MFLLHIFLFIKPCFSNHWIHLMADNWSFSSHLQIQSNVTCHERRSTLVYLWPCLAYKAFFSQFSLETALYLSSAVLGIDDPVKHSLKTDYKINACVRRCYLTALVLPHPQSQQKYNMMVFFYDIEISLRFTSCVDVCGPIHSGVLFFLQPHTSVQQFSKHLCLYLHSVHWL